MKVSSFSDTTDGEAYHIHAKGVFNEVCEGLREYSYMAKMFIFNKWLDNDENEYPNSIWLKKVYKEVFLVECRDLMKQQNILTRKGTKRLIEFSLILFKNDDMYYERMGWLVNRCFDICDVWNSGTLESRIALLNVLRTEFLEYEKRTDRIKHLQRVWAFGINCYQSDPVLRQMVDWFMKYLAAHKAELGKPGFWNPNELSRLGIHAFNPQNWYPIGRGAGWHMIHGGTG